MKKSLRDHYTASAAFKYTSKTHVKELTMWHFNRSLTSRWFDLISKTEATHVVTRIEYGASVILQYTKSISRTHQEFKANGALKASMDVFLCKSSFYVNFRKTVSWALVLLAEKILSNFKKFFVVFPCCFHSNWIVILLFQNRIHFKTLE